MKIYFLPALGVLLLFLGCQKKELRTPAGFRYTMHKDAPGDPAKAGDLVFFHVKVTTNEGDSIHYDTEKDDPTMPRIKMPSPEEIQGMPPAPHLELLYLMSKGDSATVVWEIDTVSQKPPGFENAKEIRYHMVVVDIQSSTDLDAARDKVKPRVEEFAAAMRSGTPPSGLKTTASGLKYLIVEPGDGPLAEDGKEVEVDYYGALTDGTLFDNSFSRGEPLPFTVGDPGLIAGWMEGVRFLKKGGKALLFIPSALGYGPQGAPPVIPPDADLIFYIELKSVK
jgi:FKBP-type peptidyl-prolyl cis-trans isomerase FkpA